MATVLHNFQTCAGYRCPECGGAVISLVGAFAVPGDMFRLKCTCGESEMTVTLTADSARIHLPCLFCPNPHHYTI